MSLITRCAHCHSVFRITLEQLQAHGGQVRCGRCMQVFNGLAGLTPETLETRAEMPAAEPGPATQIPPSPSPSAEPVAATSVPATPTLEPADELSPPSERRDRTTEPGPDSLLDPLPEPEPVEVRAAASGMQAPAVVEDNPYTQALPAEEASTTNRQPLLAATSVLLALVLGAQAVYFYRGEIAARHPLARQWLNEACVRAGCVVHLPQRPKSVLIEASDLQVVNPAQPGRIQLTATLRNHAGHAVGYPALDLVLTNVNDHTLVRRIYLPVEYLGAQRDPRAGIAANAELTVRLALEIGQLGAAGFRLAVLPAPLL